MSISLRKLAARLIAAVMTVSAVTAANAAALEQPGCGTLFQSECFGRNGTHIG